MIAKSSMVTVLHRHPKSNIRLFVFDWDGTALGGHDPYDRFPKEFVRFLDGLAKQGIGWATNTTWAVETQYKVIKTSGVKSLPVFLAGSSGRIAAHMTKRGLIPNHPYARWIESLDRMFDKRVGKTLRRIAAQLLRDGLVDQLDFNPYRHRYMTVNFASTSESRQGWRLISPLLETGNMYRIVGKGNNDTILPTYMNKGTVIAYMQKRLGLRAEETMVAGDGWNDRHMFKTDVAGWMVCPANAHPGIKALVRKHDGVIGRQRYSWGVIEAAEKLMNR
ncbi:MAG: HAD hydrolase family protein [Kiritimatiellaeota bacterium]|nr:HAD hydrolase family protein [Kiritimatiellota bacterium]